MIHSTAPTSDRLSRRVRSFLALAGCLLAGLLATAASLQPDPRGLGTHQQLGLPPCWIKDHFGKRCPSCGMTTSWANLLHGHPIRAVRTHATGTALAVVAMVAAAWMLASAALGRWIAAASENVVMWSALALVGLILVEWACRVWVEWS